MSTLSSSALQAKNKKRTNKQFKNFLINIFLQGRDPVPLHIIVLRISIRVPRQHIQEERSISLNHVTNNTKTETFHSILHRHFCLLFPYFQQT